MRRRHPGGAAWLAGLMWLLSAGGSFTMAQKTSIYIAGFFPVNSSYPQGAIGIGVLPAMHLALEHINNNSRILKNYELNITWNNTQCDAAVGLKGLFDMVFNPPKKVMLFGAACTQVTDPVAKTSRFWHMAQLSYADTHPMFSATKYPNFFRVVPSENDFNAPRVRLLLTYNWTLVGTLYQNEPRYSLAHNKLLKDLDTVKIEIAETQSFADELNTELTKLKDKDVRIILGNFNETWARRIFCEAFKLGMYGRKYQWLIVTMYSEKWWENLEVTLPCTREQMMQALEGYIATDLLPLRTDNVTTTSGLTAKQYQDHYNKNRAGSYSRFHGYTYDGVWTIAMALETVTKKLYHQRLPFSIRDFEYRDPFWGTTFLEALKGTNFEGVTGPISFIENERRGNILLKQFQKGREIKVGEYDGLTGVLDLSKGAPISWRGSSPPMDRTLITYVQTRVNLTIYSILATIASLGIIASCVFLTVNIKFRNQRFIKMSSPYLNNLIIIGCILTYTSVILLGLDSELTSINAFPYICTVRAWVLMSGFSLAFGSMFSKTWRVHAIFTNITLNKKVIKDYQLFMIVGILQAVDIAIMTTWQVVDPFYRETKNLTAVVHNINEDIQIIPVIEYCKSDRMTVFLGVIYAYKGLLMVFGCFLAWETRHVSIPALNDSKYIGMSVYNVVIMCVIGAAISFVLADQQNASFIMISIFIIFCTTTTLCLVFVPKLIELKRNPQGADKRARATFKPSLGKRRDSEESDMQETLKTLQEENQKCRKTLREKDLELQALLKQLGEDAHDVFGTDLRDRSKIPRKVEILRREGELAVVDDDMNSMFSSSSQEDQGQMTEETEVTVEKKGASFSLNLPTIEASVDSEMETTDIPPPAVEEPSAFSFLKRKGSVAKGLRETLPLIDLTPIGDRTEQPLALIDWNYSEKSLHNIPQRGTFIEAEMTAQKLRELPPSKVSDSGKESGSESSRACSVFTIEANSPTLQIRRALSLGRRGYMPMSKQQSQDLESPPPQDILPESRILPRAMARRHSSGTPLARRRRMSPRDLTVNRRVQPHHQPPTTQPGAQPVTLRSDNGTKQVKSYPTLKCDIVESL